MFVQRDRSIANKNTGGNLQQAVNTETKHSKRILVVDDSEVQAKSLGMLLELMGHEVRLAFNGPSALEALPDFQPEVALVDVGLPGMSGYDVARGIREQPQFRFIVLIAQTGWGREEDRERSREAGFDHHLAKPLDHQLLQQILASSFEER
ncbi:MAG TPA: response regulator [Nitrospiraceae bacterium]|nr:response regulator [Nitrospiraceae bacterium]